MISYIYQLTDQTDIQRSCILELLSTVDPPEPVDLDTSDTNNRDKNKNKNTDTGPPDTNKKKYDATLLLALLALLCEFAFLFSGSQEEVVRFLYRLTNILKNCSGAYSPFFLSFYSRLFTHACSYSCY